MNQDVVIDVRNITKSFKVYKDRSNTLKEYAIHSKRRKYEINDVIKGISFQVKKGEAVGLIGRNGCGKSTTLKLLTRIMYPDSGDIVMKGRVSSLIELGAGFHPDMSGRENIYINASIFGLTKKEIDNRVDSIIKFSELGEFIDNPVRTYSSGMYMRLAFSVAINVDAEILLIDEILAVGDAGFQTKCFNKLQEIKKKGTTIVIVSHSMAQIESICDKSIWIHEGLVKAIGQPRNVHPLYMAYMAEERKIINEREKDEVDRKIDEEEQQKDNESSDSTLRWGNFNARISSVELINDKGEKTSSFCTLDDIKIVVKYDIKKSIENAIFGIGIFREDGVYCYGTNTLIDEGEKYTITENGQFEVMLKSVSLLPGKYTLDVAIESGESIPVDYWRNVVEFTIYSAKTDVGVCRLQHSWRH